ncbi:hypothetical protein Tco_0898710, partial [Tanacetum coccineum]
MLIDLGITFSLLVINTLLTNEATTDRVHCPLVLFLGNTDNPDLTIEEYIKLEAEKARRRGRNFNRENATYDMAGLPPRAQRHLWLRYEVEGYTKEIVQDYEQRHATIFGRQVNRVHILDFEGLTEEMRQGLPDRLRMVYTGAQGQVLFTSHAWRRLFEIQGPLLGGATRSMTWRQLILALGLHTAEEMAGDGFEAYWLGSTRAIPNKRDLRAYWTVISSDGDFLGVVPSYTLIRDPLRRLCHRLISFSISGRAQAPEKVTATDLFYLRSMDEGWTARGGEFRVEVSDGTIAHVNLRVLGAGILTSAAGLVFGCLFLTLALVVLVEIKLGKLACLDWYGLASVVPLVVLVPSAL